MCCFSQPIESVSETKVFARRSQKWQYLVYQMNLVTQSDVAMVLPLPIELSNREKTIQFINLSGYPKFFEDMERCFPRSRSRSLNNQPVAASVIDTLKVYRVGSFDTSFVPAIQDLDRLDRRFRLPNSVWQDLPNYSDYGFAVFKFRSGEQKVHPMALKFMMRNQARIFFPTVHIHNGLVEKEAKFDHTLYIQSTINSCYGWRKSISFPDKVMDIDNVLKGDRTHGIIAKYKRLYRKKLVGYLKNQDIWVDNI